ncbi:fibrinogen-like protein A [Apostichopus japonicus]|uniref:fibrinogen-like protein A n=1 Tax=Stichopus japonicus TaxID=307972 RepID=UPI003AB3E0BA
MDDTQSFHLDWSDYKAGFGNLSENFWLGNEKIYSLTNQRQYELRIDLGNVYNQKFYAVCDSFSISDESQEYTLRLGSYSGDAGDALSFHKDYPFSTRDNDNDALDYPSSYENIAAQEQGGWWHRNYPLSGYVSSLNSAEWYPESLWHTEEVGMAQINYSDMKIRAIA